MSDGVNKLELYVKANGIAASLQEKIYRRLPVFLCEEAPELCSIYNDHFLKEGMKKESSRCKSCVLRVMAFFLSKEKYEYYKNNPF